MTCLKKLTSLNNCKLTMINFVGVWLGQETCTAIEQSSSLLLGVQVPCKLLCFGFCLCCFCFARLACSLLSNQIWKICIDDNLCAYLPCFKN